MRRNKWRSLFVTISPGPNAVFWLPVFVGAKINTATIAPLWVLGLILFTRFLVYVLVKIKRKKQGRLAFKNERDERRAGSENVRNKEPILRGRQLKEKRAQKGRCGFDELGNSFRSRTGRPCQNIIAIEQRFVFSFFFLFVKT